MKLSLAYAGGLYDRTVALQNGLVSAEGIDLNYVMMHAGEFQRRQARNAEFDASEFSLSTYTILLSQGDRRLIGIPVFPSRRFRHSDIYINTKAGIRQPKDLLGKRVGAMEYQQTAGVGFAVFWKMNMVSVLNKSNGILAVIMNQKIILSGFQLPCRPTYGP